MKTVLFALNASYSHTNLAVRAIGTSLICAGMETAIVERNLKDTRDAVLHALYREHADIYGFSVYIWNASEMYRFAAELKILLPESVIIFGGPEVSFCDESFFRIHPYVDFIISGEGEDSFLSLCGMLLRGEAPPRIFIADPYSDFVKNGIYYDKIGNEPHGLVYYESVRGCPFSCTYCLSSVKEGIRAKIAEKALADLLLFEQFHDIRTVKLVDRTFNFDRERAKVIWRALIGERYTKEYHFEICAALLDEESFEILSHVPKGKFRFEIGVQSTNPDTLRAIRRFLDTETTLAALKRLSDMGNLHIHADLIAGLPYEDFHSFGRSFDAVYGSCDVLQLGFLKLLSGSYMREHAEDFGIRYSPIPPYQVLETADMCFEQIIQLEKIEGMVERFSNSGKFSYTFPYLPLSCGSAFSFFCRLVKFFEERFGTCEISKLSQTDAFFLILSFSSEIARENPAVDTEQIRERLSLDFLLGEKRRLPSFLSVGTVSQKERKHILMRIPVHERAGCEVVRYRFLGGMPMIVDRNGRKLIKP